VQQGGMQEEVQNIALLSVLHTLHENQNREIGL
jgi:hypothetical protein